MERPPLIVLELVLAFAVPIGWGVWELLSLRRDRQRQERAAREKESETAAATAEPAAVSSDRPD